MKNKLSKPARRVQELLDRKGFPFDVLELPGSTRTARDAAQAVGCAVPQIAKTIIFKTAASSQPVMAVISGANRADLKKLSSHFGESITNADADFVKTQTGFSIGGVAPVRTKNPMAVYIDEDLLKFTEVWAAAGTPYAVFKLEPHQLAELTNGKVIDLKT